MFRRGNIGSILMACLLAEVVIFVAVAERIGVGDTLLLTLVSGALGAVMLRRSGKSALATLRSLSSADLGKEGALVDDVLASVGALLLILPGFVSDLIGLALILPFGRQWAMRRFKLGTVVAPRAAGRTASQTIDLGADDWTRLDNMRSR